jgi:hypothetical protein
MAGINQGTPEVAVGEPVRLGDNGEYELEHDPVTDRLIVRDTVNDKEAYVRPETNEQIGNQGAFIRALVNNEALADDGTTYASIQEAERNSNGWMFIPPGTFNETLYIQTAGLTVSGAGRGTVINGGSAGPAVTVEAEDVSVLDLSAKTPLADSQNHIAVDSFGDNALFKRVYVPESASLGIELNNVGKNQTAVNCMVENSDGVGIFGYSNNAIVSGCIVRDTGDGNIKMRGQDSIISSNICMNAAEKGIEADTDGICIGNRVDNATSDGIRVNTANDVLLANNRVSNSGGQDISNNGTGTVLDANLTGGSN